MVGRDNGRGQGNNRGNGRSEDTETKKKKTKYSSPIYDILLSQELDIQFTTFADTFEVKNMLKMYSPTFTKTQL